MAAFEKSPSAKSESLVFSGVEQADNFREKTQENFDATAQKTAREATAEVLAQEFSAAGHSVSYSSLSRPWEHTPAEHDEVQDLANLAFERDLPTALAKARASKSYPRNIDLLHDVLVSEMYDEVVKHKVNKQPLLGWLIVSLSLFLASVITSILILYLL